MKTLNTAMFIIAAFSFTLLTSCAEDPLLQENNTTVKTVKGVKISNRDSKINRHWFDNGNPNGIQGVDFGCFEPPQACFDDVIVTGQKLNLVNDIFANVSSWSSSEMQEFFEENFDDMVDVIGEDETTGLSDGTYIIRTRGTINDAARYLITKEGSAIISVTPIDN